MSVKFCTIPALRTIFILKSARQNFSECAENHKVLQSHFSMTFFNISKCEVLQMLELMFFEKMDIDNFIHILSLY